MEEQKIEGDIKSELAAYCERYDVPMEYLMDIISDQKVLPMIRGKGVEYNLFSLLTNLLNKNEWRVEKRNINPQPNKIDEDVVVVHIKTGIEIIVECKSAVRGSFRLSVPKIKQPHFHVKCHKSRSYIGKVTNDKYLVNEFDIVISNPSNSLITSGEKFEIYSDSKVIEYLKEYYKTENPEPIFKASCKDWRFAIGIEIAKDDGTIPRTPLVLFENDPHWKDLSQIENAFLQTLKSKSKV